MRHTQVGVLTMTIQELGSIGGATVLGPMLMGLKESVQICSLGATVSDIVNMATISAYDVNEKDAHAALKAQ